MYKNIIKAFFILSIFLIIIPANSSNKALLDFPEKEKNTKLGLVLGQNAQDSITTGQKSLDLDSLKKYLAALYDDNSNSFTVSNTRKINTTISTARGLAVLKMTGLQGFLIPNSRKLNVFNGLGSLTTNGGYKIHNSYKQATIMGTYGAVLSTELMNLNLKLVQMKDEVQRFVLSLYRKDNSSGGFYENTDLSAQLSIKTTYYAVSILNILNFQFNDTIVNEITNFLKNTWSGEKKYFVSSIDFDQTEIVTSFQASSILYLLNQTHSIDTAFWNTIKASLSSYLSAKQQMSGLLSGGISSEKIKDANVVDTGAALSIHHLFNHSTSINVSQGVSFILNSQLPKNLLTIERGGFSLNNETHDDPIETGNGVKLSYTYYATLGLYSSGYLTNNTKFTFSTDYSKSCKGQCQYNEIIPGQESTISSEIETLDGFTYFSDSDVKITVDGLHVVYNRTGGTNGDIFIHKILNTTSNWTLGSHKLTAVYSLANISFLPIIEKVVSDTIIIRLPFNLSINSIEQTINVKPGDFLDGKIKFNNDSINMNYLGLSVLGNVSINLVYPNGTMEELHSANDYPLAIETKIYSFNYTLANDTQLGDYFIKIMYTNGTGSLFYSQIQLRVKTQLHLLAIDSLTSTPLQIFPNSPFNLNFTINYENQQISPFATSVKAKFIQNVTQTELFSVNLSYVSGSIFSTNQTELVPIDLFMGYYTVSIEIEWFSSTTNESITSIVSNDSLSVVKYSASPILSLVDNIANFEVNSGQTLNLTGYVGVKAANSNKVYPINSSTSITSELVNASNKENVIQSLTYNYLNDPKDKSKFTLTGEINPNINLLSDVNITIQSKILLRSTNLNVELLNPDETIFGPNFIFKKANLKLDQNSVEYLTGSEKVIVGSLPSMVVNLKILSEDKFYVSGLDLNASLLVPSETGTNTTERLLPTVISVADNYQVVIPLLNLKEGNYSVKIKTSEANLVLGSFTFTIELSQVDTSISIETIFLFSVILVGVFVTIVNIKVKRT